MLEDEATQVKQPARSRALLSTEDFRLIRTAISEYMRTVEDPDERRKYANLFHRFGRMS